MSIRDVRRLCHTYLLYIPIHCHRRYVRPFDTIVSGAEVVGGIFRANYSVVDSIDEGSDFIVLLFCLNLIDFPQREIGKNVPHPTHCSVDVSTIQRG